MHERTYLVLSLFICLPVGSQPDPAVFVRGLGSIRGEQRSVAPLDRQGSTNVDFFVAPFAEPPLDHRRFKPPVPKGPWTETFVTRGKTKACYHEADTTFVGFQGAEMWNSHEASEDCLYLNIWRKTPLRPTNELKTVMVWIFGGGFFSGSPSLSLYDGSVLAAEHDVIVVNINYRISAFGFLYFGTKDAPGNVGLLDQQLALKWVYDHIQHFGGDPAKITVFGESAGGASTSAHLIAPDSQKYVHKVILQSASMLAPWACKDKGFLSKKAQDFASRLGCGGIATSKEKASAAECLRQLPTKNISKGATGVMEGFMDFGFVPVCEDEFFFKGNARQLAREGRFKRVPTIAGVMKDEGSFWLFYYLSKYYNQSTDSLMSRKDFVDSVGRAFKKELKEVFISAVTQHYDQLLLRKREPDQCLDMASRGTEYRDLISQAVGDYHFVCDCLLFASKMASTKVPVYQYYFEAVSSTNPWPKWAGAMHGYEIEYEFGLPLIDSRYSDGDRKLARKMMAFWTHFAKTGQPTASNATAKWPPSNEGNKFIQLSADPKTAAEVIISDVKTDECRVWNQISDIKYQLSEVNKNQATTRSLPTVLTLVAILSYLTVFS